MEWSMRLIKDNFSETEYWMGFSMKRQGKLELKKEEIVMCKKKKKLQVRVSESQQLMQIWE